MCTASERTQRASKNGPNWLRSTFSIVQLTVFTGCNTTSHSTMHVRQASSMGAVTSHYSISLVVKFFIALHAPLLLSSPYMCRQVVDSVGIQVYQQQCDQAHMHTHHASRTTPLLIHLLFLGHDIGAQLGIAVYVAVGLAPLARSHQPGEHHDAEVRCPLAFTARWCL
jgi:hypothetical protein